MTTKKFTLTAMFTALVCVATLIYIPTVRGYINMGDAVLLLSTFMLGPVSGAIAGGLGSCIADIILGYSLYAPATLIIKALMGFSAGCIAKRSNSFPFTAIAAISAELIMAFGYFLFEAFILDFGISVFFTSIPGNLVQGLFGIIISIVLFSVLKKNKYIIRLTK